MDIKNAGSYKKLILTKYDQVSIFANYLDINPSEIDYCLQSVSNKISNPLRNDPNPSLGFTTVIDREVGVFKIRMYDFGDSYYRGDCFDLVGKLLSTNSSDSVGFITICKDIINTMERGNSVNYRTLIPSIQKFTNIHVEPRLWNSFDINLWDSWGLHFNEIRQDVYPISKAYVNHMLDYKYNSSDPGYAWITDYKDNEPLYKLYYPNRGKKKGDLPRFKTNNKYYPLEGIHKMKAADILVITKSWKDRLLIKKIVTKLHSKYTIEVTNVSAEGIVISKEFITNLNTIYIKLVSNFDFDRAGLIGSGILKRQYGVERFMFTNGKYGTINFGGKDATDICKAFGYDYISNLIYNAYEYIERELDYQNSTYNDESQF
jgi:hypothetical protein